MAEPTFSNSAVGPVVGFIIGVVLMAIGGLMLGMLGGLVAFGSVILFVVRLLALLSRAGTRRKPTEGD